MSLVFRPATRQDIPTIVAMLADDVLGAKRESGADLAPYYDAFDRMQEEGGNLLLVGELAGQAVATYQLTYISGLSLKAARRAVLESVRVARQARGQGLGAALLRDAEERARAAGCSLLQLTTNRRREDAHRFYLRQGYEDSHLGFKKPL